MNEDFRKNAPAPLEALPFNIPKPVETTLSNGLKVVIVSDSRHPLVSFRLAFYLGDTSDPEGRTGLTSALASLLNEGTAGYKSKALAEEIERMGADLAASSGSDNTVVRASALSVFAPDIIRLMSEIALRPEFPQNELDLYKQNAIEGLKYQRSQPDFLADEQVARLIYGKHPYSVHSPSESDIEKLTRKQMRAHHRTLFVPNNAVFVAVGDIGPDQLITELENEFGSWEPGKVPPQEFPDIPARKARTLTVVDRPGSTQANIVLSNTAIRRNSPDYFPVLVMNQILGAGASSRLFMNLREDKGYTYGAYSRIYAKRFAGSFEATSEVRTAVTKDSLSEFFYELARIRDETAEEQELLDAKNFLTGVFPIRAETQSGLIQQIVTQKLFDLPDDFLESYRDKVNAVSLEDVLRVARICIEPEKLAIVIVGDAGEVLPQASEFAGSVEVFDSEGNVKEPDSYLRDGSEETVDASGEWDLEVTAQGQKMPFKLILKQEGSGIEGQVESMLGIGVIKNGRVKGRKVTAVVISEVQEQEIEMNLICAVEGDLMNGTLTVPMMPEPLAFTGRRAELPAAKSKKM